MSLPTLESMEPPPDIAGLVTQYLVRHRSNDQNGTANEGLQETGPAYCPDEFSVNIAGPATEPRR
jgi:hypothetical protein